MTFDATKYIQAAIDDCSSSNGTVVLDAPPHSNYSTGALLLTGSVHLYVPPTITLDASHRREDYPGPQTHWYLIHFRNCTGCSITGEGAIDAHGRDYVTGVLPQSKTVKNFQDPSCFNPWECRPRMIGAVDSIDVVIGKGLIIHDPIYWCVHVIGSKKVKIQNLTIRGDWQIFNNDGIDVDSSEDVLIEDTDIDTADDAVCLKTTRKGQPLRDITVRNCRLRSRAAVVKLGSESVADMENIHVHDIDAHNSHRGLAIQLRDGGNIDNVIFRNIVIDRLHHEEFAWWGAAEVIYVTAEPRHDMHDAVGTVSNVVYSNITATSENGIFVSGSPGKNVVNLVVQNVRITMQYLSRFPGGLQDYRPGPLDVLKSGATAALWAQGAENVRFEGVKVEYIVDKETGEVPRRDWKDPNVFIDDGSVERLTISDDCDWGKVPIPPSSRF